MALPAFIAAIGRILGPRAAASGLGRTAAGTGARGLFRRTAIRRAGTGEAAKTIRQTTPPPLKRPPAGPRSAENVLRPEIVVQQRGAPPVQGGSVQPPPVQQFPRMKPPVQPPRPPQGAAQGGLSGVVKQLGTHVENLTRRALRLPEAPARTDGPQQEATRQPIDAGRAMMEELARGRNFGDVMSGKKTLQDVQQEGQERQAARESERRAEDEAQAEEQLTQAKEEAKRATVLLGIKMGGLTLAMAKLPAITERFGRAILQQSESLRRYSGQINAAFARLQRQDIRMSFAEARATEGSTAALADALGDLKSETREIRHATKTVVVLLANGVVQIGRLVNLVVESNLFFRGARAVLDRIEAEMRRRQARESIPWADFLGRLADGEFAGSHEDRRRNARGRR